MPDPEVVQGLNLPIVESQQVDPMAGGSGAGEANHATPSEGKVAEKARPPAAKSTEESPVPPFVLSEGLAPIPAKLVAKIQRGEFVDMAEFLRDNLEAIRRGALSDQLTVPHQPRRNRREVPDLLSWVQCFGTYMAVITAKHPERIRQLLAYQTLVVREARRCGGRGWLAYDSMFRQQVAGNTEADWSKLNSSLYAVSFLAHAGGGKTCSLSMESDHGDDDCALATPKAGGSGGKYPKPVTRQEGVELGARFAKGKTKMVCFAWNQGKCNFPYCRYRHVCVKCSGDHRITQCRVITVEREGPRRLGRDARPAVDGRDPVPR